jgi:ribosomal protein S18 acetylase RimI-like enzyme
VAFVVREDFQGQKVAGHLLGVLEKIARENKFTHFTASVLPDNHAMIRVFKRRYPNAKVTSSASELQVVMNFEDAVEPQDPVPACAS